jgi:hypothetical protein
MDKQEELLELDIAEIAAVSGGATVNEVVQKNIAHVVCVQQGGDWIDTGTYGMCYGPAK